MQSQFTVNNLFYLQAGDKFVSDFLVIYPQDSIAAPGKYMEVTLKVDGDNSNIAVYRSSSDTDFATWTKMETTVDGDVAKFQAQSGGVYVAKSHSYTVLIVALVVSIVAVALIVVGGVMYFKRNPNKWKNLKNESQNIPRNFQSKV